MSEHLPVPEDVKRDILDVFGEIAAAESHVHGVEIPNVHFHEVGSMDAVADVTAACIMMRALSPDEVIASPVHVGFGSVRCAHGILPVPAPATAHILRGIPIAAGQFEGELCTPTGAALLRRFVTRFGEMPVMTVSAIGYGMGQKDFPAANCVRAMLGETADRRDAIVRLSCGVDDMTAEEIGFACQKLFECGALDVYTVPVGMKKGRPGTLIAVLCEPDDARRLAGEMFRHTSTLGVRSAVMERYVLARTVETVDTPLGPVRKKTASGYGVTKEKYEYDDLARLAKERGLSLKEVIGLLEEDAFER